MAKKIMAWKTKGMNRDLSVSAFNPEFAFENMNLRLATNEGNTMMSWVNERGTKNMFADITVICKNEKTGEKEEKIEHTIYGIPVGQAVLEHQLVLFTTESVDNEERVNPDRIYVLHYEEKEESYLVGKLMFNGNLHFSPDCPLETLVSYEAEDVQKVYWTDGKNQPRVINIADSRVELRGEKKYADQDNYELYDNNYPWNDHAFDFVGTLDLKEEVTIHKELNSSGSFPAGVIQYAFTYYNRYGQESNIFYTSPLLYVSHEDRGAAPDEKVENAFRINISYLDESFEYLRIYSIQRTSLNAVPIVKRVQDLLIKEAQEESDNDYNCFKKISFLDTGTMGNTVDPTELLYKGGEDIRVQTLDQKDGTLFLGNIGITRTQFTDKKFNITVSNAYRYIAPTVVSSSDNYKYSNQLSSDEVINGTKKKNTVPCAGFKFGDYYRCGVQFQYKTGKWSDPIFINDVAIENKPELDPDTNYIKLPVLKGFIPENKATELIKMGYKKARAVVVYPEVQDRVVLNQGVLCPTLSMASKSNRGELHAQSSWFFRPYGEAGIDNRDGTALPVNNGELPYTDRNIEQTYNINAGDLSDAAIVNGDKYRIDGVNVIYNDAVQPATITINGKKYYIGANVKREEKKYAHVSEPDIYYYIDNNEVKLEGNTLTVTGNRYNPAEIRQVEIQGDFDKPNRFYVNRDILTYHSPDVEFDEISPRPAYIGSSFRTVGKALFKKTFSSIDIQTETPTISSSGTGFEDAGFTKEGAYGMISGLFYDDYVVDEWNDDKTMIAFDKENSSYKWLVYPWHGTGSLNNDIKRPANYGTQSAILKKKVLSHLRYADTSFDKNSPYNMRDGSPQLFYSDQVSIVKLDDKIYEGNIDTSLVPNHSDGMYFAFDGANYDASNVTTPFESTNWWKTFSTNESTSEAWGLYKWNGVSWTRNGQSVGNKFVDLVIQRKTVRMKYKSTPHLVMSFSTPAPSSTDDTYNTLPIGELYRNGDPDSESYYRSTMFGGQTIDAWKENVWIPCGEPVRLENLKENPETHELEQQDVSFEYSWGDTYYQRWDCMKTYAFTPEDINQIVEIGSFMLETHVNIDGRYDRNRGQHDNTNMSPQNFNLLNPVYSQLNNFFTYRIQDEDYYERKEYPNQITWTLTKENGADVDRWTQVSLASIMELDGDKGKITKLTRLNDQLIAFQDTGISQILYNENVQISSTDGVPIEIANSGKVQGRRYISNTVGCSNKWSMVTTPLGIYFMDSNEKSIYRIGDGLQNISLQGGFNAWCKQNIPAMNVTWGPELVKEGESYFYNLNNFVTYYDKANQDVLFINKEHCLAFSEKIGAFTSFYSYENVPYFCQVNDKSLWIVGSATDDGTGRIQNIVTYTYLHQKGYYNEFLGKKKPYWMTLVGNPEPQMDKIFTNLEFRACVEGDGPSEEFKPYLPFDSLEVWNEYQHGYTDLEYKDGRGSMLHNLSDAPSHLARKFRIWRCDIPRDNVPVSNENEDEVNYTSDSKLGISRIASHPVDRMRNPWLYLKLQKRLETKRNFHKVEIHDMMMSYFG